MGHVSYSFLLGDVIEINPCLKHSMKPPTTVRTRESPIVLRAFSFAIPFYRAIAAEATDAAAAGSAYCCAAAADVAAAGPAVDAPAAAAGDTAAAAADAVAGASASLAAAA